MGAAAVPRTLLPRHAARRHAHVVQHVRRDPGSVQGQKSRADGLAKNPRTNYQAMFRSGSHQSATRGWLKPTWMTDSLVRKEFFGQALGKGFLQDVHCPTGAPREAFVKISRAEPGGIAGQALWRPAALGIRPRYESDAMSSISPAGSSTRGGAARHHEGVAAWPACTTGNWAARWPTGTPSRPQRQFAAIFDTNKCIACQTCTLACKTTWTSGKGQEYMLWNNVETKPTDHPRLKWDLELLAMLQGGKWNGRTYEGETIFESAPAGERVLSWRPGGDDYAYPNVGEDDCFGQIDGGAGFSMPHMAWFYYLAHICNHCTYPACLQSPRGSIYKRPEDGIVLVDQGRCRGYRECVKACPYKKVFFNPMTGTSEKCIACYPKMEMGLQPQCFVNCIGKIRMAGYISKPEQARPDNPIDYLVHVRKVGAAAVSAVRPRAQRLLHPAGPRPAGLPPSDVRARGRRGDQDLSQRAERSIFAGLMGLFGSTESVMTRRSRRGDEIIGADDTNTPLVQVPLREPVHAGRRSTSCTRSGAPTVRSEAIMKNVLSAVLVVASVGVAACRRPPAPAPEVIAVVARRPPDDPGAEAWRGAGTCGEAAAAGPRRAAARQVICGRARPGRSPTDRRSRCIEWADIGRTTCPGRDGSSTAAPFRCRRGGRRDAGSADGAGRPRRAHHILARRLAGIRERACGFDRRPLPERRHRPLPLRGALARERLR